MVLGKIKFVQTVGLLSPARRESQPPVAWVLPTNEQRWFDSDVWAEGRGRSPRYDLLQRQLVPSPVRRGKVRMGVALWF